MTNDHQTRVILQIRDLLDELEGATKTQERIQVALFGGPYAGMNPSLSHQPEKIQVGKQIYVRIDDPDTGKSLEAYSWEKND